MWIGVLIFLIAYNNFQFTYFGNFVGIVLSFSDTEIAACVFLPYSFTLLGCCLNLVHILQMNLKFPAWSLLFIKINKIIFLKSKATKTPQSVKVIVFVSLNFFAYLKIEAMKTLEVKFTKIVSEVFRGSISGIFFPVHF